MRFLRQHKTQETDVGDVIPVRIIGDQIPRARRHRLLRFRPRGCRLCRSRKLLRKVPGFWYMIILWPMYTVRSEGVFSTFARTTTSCVNLCASKRGSSIRKRPSENRKQTKSLSKRGRRSSCRRSFVMGYALQLHKIVRFIEACTAETIASVG